MLVGIIMSLVVSEPESEKPAALGMRQALSAPFFEYLGRRGWSGVILVLCFMFLYKLGDSMATALTMPFYLEMGFTKTEIGLVGGLIMLRVGINRALWMFGGVQMASILGFALLASSEPDLWLLALVIAFEYLGVGMGTAAFTAFIARETSKTYAATQFALFTALAAVPRTLVNGSTGIIVENIGWVDFFLLCTCLAVPGMLLLIWVAPWAGQKSAVLVEQ